MKIVAKYVDDPLPPPSHLLLTLFNSLDLRFISSQNFNCPDYKDPHVTIQFGIGKIVFHKVCLKKFLTMLIIRKDVRLPLILQRAMAAEAEAAREARAKVSIGSF